MTGRRAFVLHSIGNDPVLLTRPAGLAAGKLGRRPVVGVLIPSITNPVFASSLSSIQNRMLVAGHGVVIAQSNYDPGREPDAVASLLNDRPTGLILTVCDPLTSAALPPSLPPPAFDWQPSVPSSRNEFSSSSSRRCSRINNIALTLL